ncbi:MAG: hypothetical protein Q8P67_28950 [archaeon]|nr:hypothetical protein [archaeon]
MDVAKERAVVEEEGTRAIFLSKQKEMRRFFPMVAKKYYCRELFFFPMRPG